MIPQEHRFEKWANFPSELDRFYGVVSTTIKPVILLSCDRHISEVSKIELDDYPHPLYECSSSSLTSPWDEAKEESNQFREKDIVFKTNFATLDIAFQNEELKLEICFITKKQ